MNDLLRIIVVDDDPLLLELLSDFFESSGLRCRVFSDAEAALDELSRTSFDIMITDIELPGMKGLALAEQAKRMAPDMSIIVTTGYIVEYSYDQAIAAGASDFIRKPFDLNELMVRIKHVRFQERLKKMSVTDELTGLPNRRGFFALAEQQLRSAQRSGAGLVLLFADLDDFKQINDSLGHQAGDEALAHMSRLLRLSCRDSDIIARMGGDEFAVLLINPAEDGVAAARERLRDNIDAFNARPNAPYCLSISIGEAPLYPGDYRTIDDLMKTADERMYREKERKKRVRSER